MCTPFPAGPRADLGVPWSSGTQRCLLPFACARPVWAAGWVARPVRIFACENILPVLRVRNFGAYKASNVVHGVSRRAGNGILLIPICGCSKVSLRSSSIPPFPIPQEERRGEGAICTWYCPSCRLAYLEHFLLHHSESWPNSGQPRRCHTWLGLALR